MIFLSSAATTLLSDLLALGMDLQPHGDAIRFRPKTVMTPALLERLQANKAELLRFLDTASAMTAVRQSVDKLLKESAWRSAWEKRFKSARYANLDALERILELIISQAEDHHRRRDWAAFSSTCTYLHRLASGEIWDESERTRPICSQT
jgi:hypothetical protein